MLQPRALLGLAALVAVTSLPAVSSAQVAPAEGPLQLGATGVALGPTWTAVAVTLTNRGTVPVAGVQVDAVRVGDAALAKSAPIAVGAIRAGGFSVVRATLTRGALRPGGTYPLTVAGRIGVRTPFTLRGTVAVPGAAPGSSDGRSASAASHKTAGAPYPHQTPSFTDRENGPRWVVPTAPSAQPNRPSQPPSRLVRAPRGDPGGITFTANAGLGINGSTVAEPSGASGGGVIFVSSNWYAAYSTTNGGSFTKLDPTTIFPNDAIGYCCDQIVQYVPSIDRFVWLLQGNGMRLATASPAQIKSSGGKAWIYWNLPPTLFSEPAGTGVDYPDLAVGTKYLYMNWDTCFGGSPPTCNQGRQIVRASLADIAAGGTLNMGYTKPSDSANAWGGHLSQDTGDEIFWAGHNSNASLRLYSWPEGSGSYSWSDLAVGAWANTGITSITPNGQDWMNKLSGFPGNSVIGLTRSGGQVWLAWSAGTNANFPQPHVEMITVAPSGPTLVRQVQIWNTSYAFGYPALATNACTREIGLSLEYGGNKKFYENHVVGFWGDFIVYITTNSNTGTTRFGDYVTIRRDPGGKPGGAFFDAFGYGLDTGAIKTDTRYVQFGRTKCG